MQVEYGKRLLRFGVHAGLITCCLWWSLVGAWYVLSVVNFAFPVLYDIAGIGENVAQYGPQNRYKRGFERTTRVEHQRLFGEIVYAINHDGADLAEIHYRDPDGNPIDHFLRPPEVIHLQDVAKLITQLRFFGWYMAGSTLLLAGVFIYCRWPVPVTWHAVAGVVLGLVVAALAVILAGPTDVFYALHTRIFPDDHQWFFYYQESLMTTLMKAPDLFGYIALLLAVTTTVVFVALWVGWRRVVNRLAALT